MRYLIKLFRNTKLAYKIRRTPLLKNTVKSMYKIIMFPFTRSGIEVNIGGIAPCKLDYHFVFSRYEDFGDRHNASFKKWLECCREKIAVFDVGAHIGLYTIPASKVVAPNGIVFAFEPSETNKRYLERHLEYNNISNVVVLSYLVGEATKEKQLFYENRNVDPMNSLYPKKNINLYSKVYKDQISLDDFVRRYDVKPQVIKVDVEGSEYNVLKGARETINRCKPIIFLSIHPERLSLLNTSLDDVKNIISSFRYMVRDWEGREVKEFKFKEYVLTPD